MIYNSSTAVEPDVSRIKTNKLYICCTWDFISYNPVYVDKCIHVNTKFCKDNRCHCHYVDHTENQLSIQQCTSQEQDASSLEFKQLTKLKLDAYVAACVEKCMSSEVFAQNFCIFASKFGQTKLTNKDLCDTVILINLQLPKKHPMNLNW